MTLGTVTAHAQSTEKGPLTLQIKPITAMSRSGSPVAVQIELYWDLPELLEGELQLTTLVGNTPVSEFRSGELVVSNGETRFRTMLPPVDVPDEKALITIRARFLGTHETYELEDQDLLVMADWRRLFILGLVQSPNETIASDSQVFINSLELEHYNNQPQLQGHVSTIPLAVPAEDLPENSLGLVSYDLLLTHGTGIANIRPKQFDAISGWVRAGGSLCLTVDQGEYSNTTVAFLNELASHAPNAPTFMLNEAGGIMRADTTESTSFLLFPSGLGRVLVVFESIEAFNWDAPEWREAVGQLWKLRVNQIAAVRSDRHAWDFDMEAAARVANRNRSFLEELRPLAPDDEHFTNELLNVLVPAEIEGLPFSLVLSILAAFLLAIGPLDYFVLGYFNCRKFTWPLFFLLSIGFTLFTVRIAQGYMSQNDVRRTLTVIDFAPTGTAVRSNQFNVTFTASEKSIENEYRQAFWTAVDETRPVVESTSTPNYRSLRYAPQAYQNVGGEISRVDTNLPIYRGRLPTTFTVTRRMRKWSPQLDRLTFFDVEDPAIGFDFKAPFAPEWTTAEGRHSLWSQMDRIEGINCALLFHEEQVFQYVPSATSTSGRRSGRASTENATTDSTTAEDVIGDNATGDNATANNAIGDNATTDNATADASTANNATADHVSADHVSADHVSTDSDPAIEARFVAHPPFNSPRQTLLSRADHQLAVVIHDLSSPIQEGMATVAARMSPAGGRRFEDLAMFDSSNPQEWLLVIITKQNDEYTVYRKSYAARGGR